MFHKVQILQGGGRIYVKNKLSVRSHKSRNKVQLLVMVRRVWLFQHSLAFLIQLCRNRTHLKV